MNSIIQVKHSYKSGMSLKTYSKTLLATERQLSRAIKYAGFDPDIKVTKVSEGSTIHDLQVIATPLIPMVYPFFEEMLQDYFSDLGKMLLSAVFMPSSFIPRLSDIKDGKDIAKHLIQNPKGGFNINIGDNAIINSPLIQVSATDAPLMLEQLTEREKLMKRSQIKPFSEKELFFKLLDVEDDPEGKDQGVIQNITKETIPLSWKSGGLKKQARDHFRAYDSLLPLIVDGVGTMNSQGKITNYFITDMHSR